MSLSGKGSQCGISENRLHHIVFLLVTVESTPLNNLVKTEKESSRWKSASVLPQLQQNLLNDGIDVNLNICMLKKIPNKKHLLCLNKSL